MLTNILQVELDLTNASNSYSIYIYSRGWFYHHLLGRSIRGYYNIQRIQYFNFFIWLAYRADCKLLQCCFLKAIMIRYWAHKYQSYQKISVSQRCQQSIAIVQGHADGLGITGVIGIMHCYKCSHIQYISHSRMWSSTNEHPLDRK